ncbi:MAG: hypothetical protein AMXMBFR13_07000 [Phycisphaerae bacterium]
MARRFPDGSWGVRVQGVFKRRKSKPSVLDRQVGDGRYGYRTRSPSEGVTKATGWDGAPLYRSRRKSAVGKRRPGCRLVSSGECRGVDQLIVAERAREVEIRVADERARRPRFRARKGQRPGSDA